MPKLLQVHGLWYAAVIAFSLLLVANPAPAQEAVPWPPISPEELALKDDPQHPGAHAMILYREVITNDDKSSETHFVRLKIFTEQGRKYGNLEINYFKERFNIKDLEIRRISPDGTAVPFTGQVLDKVVARSRRGTSMAKTVSIPDVQPGTIIEYRYKLTWSSVWLYPTTWFIERSLATRRAYFAVKRYKVNWLESWAGFKKFNLHWASFLLPPGKQPQQLADGSVVLELENIAPFVSESNSPPGDEDRMRVQFYYAPKEIGSAEEFWHNEAKEWHRAVENFVKKHKTTDEAAAAAIRAANSPEEKLRALYARAQKVRNLSFEHRMSDQEWRRLKDVKNADDVVEYGYATRSEINRFFAALARAAGFAAEVVPISERDDKFFHKEVLDQWQFDGELALVKLDGKEIFLDPGTAFCPFGMLHWAKTATQGMRVSNDGATFVTTPPPPTDETVTDRKASLELAADGSAKGSVQITWLGRAALNQRLRALERDAEGRKKMLEDDLKRLLPTSATVTLVSAGEWEATDAAFRAELRFEMPQFANVSGKRLLVPMETFHMNVPNPFRASERTHPIHWNYPGREVDEIHLVLPSGIQVENLPAEQKRAEKFGSYEISWRTEGTSVILLRRQSWDGIAHPLSLYPLMREFGATVRAGDESQVVLRLVSGAN
jgi:hypothetical protein